MGSGTERDERARVSIDFSKVHEHDASHCNVTESYLISSNSLTHDQIVTAALTGSKLIAQVSTMPPMTLNGIVTKAGFMNKTATITVSRWVDHKLTGKVRVTILDLSFLHVETSAS